METALHIWVFCSIMGIAYQILIEPGEILQWWSRYVNFNVKDGWIKKLILCPYCLWGNISLWVCVTDFIYKGFDVYVLMAIPMTIITVYHYIHAIHR